MTSYLDISIKHKMSSSLNIIKNVGTDKNTDDSISVSACNSLHSNDCLNVLVGAIAILVVLVAVVVVVAAVLLRVVCPRLASLS